MLFQPSHHSSAPTYGDASSGQKTRGELLEEYAPVITDVLFGSDPREKYEKKKAMLATVTDLYNNASSPLLKQVYLAKVKSLQAEIKALKNIVGEERAAIITTQIAKVGAAVLFLSGAMAAIMGARYLGQKSASLKKSAVA